MTPTPTGIASIFVGETDNMIISVPGANAEVAPSDADTLINKLTAGDWLLLQLEIPSETVRHALKEARRLRIKTVLNIAPFTVEAVEPSKLAKWPKCCSR
jgi:ribokinase